jgi:hypothetical protein
MLVCNRIANNKLGAADLDGVIFRSYCRINKKPGFKANNESFILIDVFYHH